MDTKLKIMYLLSGRLFSIFHMLEIVSRSEYKEFLSPIVVSTQERKADDVGKKCFHDLCDYMICELSGEISPYSHMDDVRRTLKVMLTCYCMLPEVCEEEKIEEILRRIEEKSFFFGK